MRIAKQMKQTKTSSDHTFTYKCYINAQRSHTLYTKYIYVNYIYKKPHLILLQSCCLTFIACKLCTSDASINIEHTFPNNT